MNDQIATVLACLLTAIFGAFVGYTITNDSWSQDCKATQVHREGRNVYKCEFIKKDQS